MAQLVAAEAATPRDTADEFLDELHHRGILSISPRPAWRRSLRAAVEGGALLLSVVVIVAYVLWGVLGGCS